MSNRGRRGGRADRGDQSRPEPTVTPVWARGRGGGGRGRGAGGRGQGGGDPRQSTAPQPASSYQPVTSSATSYVASSSSAPPPSASSSALQAQQLGREIEEKLSLQHPVSGLAPPKRPGVGKVGMKCVVRANHFIVQVADRGFFHYDVSISLPCSQIAKGS